MYKGEIEKAGMLITSSSLETFDLQSVGGQTKLSESLSQTDGSAAVIVHPFFALDEVRRAGLQARTQELDIQYAVTLTSSVLECSKAGTPLILFETLQREAELARILTEMGLNSGSAYIVLTEKDSPKPAHTELGEFSNQLAQLGLKRATVGGSFLWMQPPLPHDYSKLTTANQQVPQIATEYNLEGCVGAVIDNLLQAGIVATPGPASYPVISRGEFNRRYRR